MNEKIPHINTFEQLELSNSVQIAHLESGPVLIDGVSELSVDPELADRMRVLLELQQKMDVHWKNLRGGYNKEEKDFAQINCRRAVMFLEGDLSYEEMIATTVDQEDPNIDREIILQKINTHIEEHPTHMVNSVEELRDLLDEFREPTEIHITDIFSGRSLPDHSFYCLGKDSQGTFMVAEKSGPLVGNDFYYRTLDEATADYVNSDTLYGYIAIPSSS